MECLNGSLDPSSVQASTRNRVFDLLYGGAVLTFLAGSVGSPLPEKMAKLPVSKLEKNRWSIRRGRSHRHEKGTLDVHRWLRSRPSLAAKYGEAPCRPAVNKSGHGKRDPEAQLGWKKGKRMGR
jgi:hypothetical protein